MTPGRPQLFALDSLAESIVRALARETLRDSRAVLSRIVLAILWLLHLLPLPLLAKLGEGFGMLVYAFGRERRRVVSINLKLCFPELSDRARERLLRGHCLTFGRGALENALCWWASKKRLQRVCTIEGKQYLDQMSGRPLILLAPHFVGCDIAGIRLSSEYPGISMYRRLKDPLLNELLLRGRTRFGMTTMVPDRGGLRQVVKAVKKGLPFYYLPDRDHGARDSVFTPFFGVPAATATALPRLAELTQAAVVPCIARQLPGGRGYVARFYPAWNAYPSGDESADAARMNAFIEERVREMPEQYFWNQKRFKTRPPGEAPLY
ncbi:MAG: lysophospholipid acyltransferase family protein [Burkholderiales bacterium]